ncbi:MAG: hypothetical protein AAGA48_20290 [Myxococcota bacterium]
MWIDFTPPPVVVPIHLGCCPTPPRCQLCPPSPPPPDVDLIQKLIAHYAKAQPDRPLGIAFFGGPLPEPDWLAAAAPHPVAVRVRPDFLTRKEARRLADAGVVSIELDALTLHGGALREAGRTHRSQLVIEQLEGLPALGLRRGVVLAPGLPRTTHADAIHDAEMLASRIDFVRLHPVLVLAESGLRDAQMDGQYTPLTLGEAVTTCLAMMQVFEAAGVRVTRVGANPGPDGLGRAVAGPRHPSLRQLVEARRTLERLHRELRETHPGDAIVIRCHPADETHTRGPYNDHIRSLRAAHQLASVHVTADATLPRGEVAIDNVRPEPREDG